jgi:hypothetical protein
MESPPLGHVTPVITIHDNSVMKDYWRDGGTSGELGAFGDKTHQQPDAWPKKWTIH